MSRIDQLIELLGGPENLPPKLPKPEEPVSAPEPDEDDDLPPPIQRDPNLVPPSLLKPKFLPAQKTSAPAVPMESSDGGLDFAVESRKGEPAPLGIKFVPFIAVTKYCYKYVPKQWLQPMASAFFDADQVRRPELPYTRHVLSALLTLVVLLDLHP